MAKRLVFAIAAAMLATTWLPSGASAAEAPQLDGAVQVTAAATPFRAYASPALAVDRRRPGTLALATADTRNSQCSLQVSTNGGRSWTELPGPKVSDWPNCVRNTQGPIASLAFDREGTLYYAFVGWKPTDWHSRIFLARSEDLGRTFQVTTLPGLEAHEDRGDIGSNALPAVLLDPTRPGRVYVSWSGNYGLWNLDPLLPGGKTQSDFPRRAMLATSNDGGRTFGEPIDLGVLATVLTLYDWVFTSQLSVMASLFGHLVALPFAPLAGWPVGDGGWPVGDGGWLAIGAGDLLVATVFPLVLGRAFGRGAAWLAMALGLATLAAMLTVVAFGLVASTFPAMLGLGPVCVLQYLAWSKAHGSERTTRQFRLAERIGQPVGALS
jgi:hypothetical protein